MFYFIRHAQKFLLILESHPTLPAARSSLLAITRFQTGFFDAQNAPRLLLIILLF